MGLYNTVESGVRCPCGNEEFLGVQFRYGDTYLYNYQVGDVVSWNVKSSRTNIGTLGHRKVVVDGCSLCRVCEDFVDFEVWLENDRIVAVKPATGLYDFAQTKQQFIIIED